MNTLYIIIGFLLVANIILLIILLYLLMIAKDKKEHPQQYFEIFKAYSNLDWNKTTPFKEHIDLLWYHYIYHIDENVNPLILTKDIETKFPDEKRREELESLFSKEGAEKIYNMPLSFVIFLTAVLKTYREDGIGLSNDPPLSPNEFLNKTINDFINDYNYKNIKLPTDGK